MDDAGTYIIWPFVLFYNHLVYFTAIWYILLPFGKYCGYLVYIFPVLVCCTKKNMATMCAISPRYSRVTLWRRGIVVIAAAYRTEDRRFESRQGVRFLGLYTLQCCSQNLICIVIVLKK
jgi:hypothetical protein